MSKQQKIVRSQTLYDESGKVLAAERVKCPHCLQVALVKWREGDEPHALCLNIDCPFEY